MITVNVYTIEKVGGIFTLYKSIDVVRVPNIGEKIVLTGDSFKAFVHEVIDIHFKEDQEIDLYTKNKGYDIDYTVNLAEEIEDLNE